MRIFLNSKEYFCDKSDIFSLKNSLNLQDPITIIDGFASDENLEIKENMEIFFIEKGKNLTPCELKAVMKSRNSPQINEKLQNASVAICGLGGLGSNVAISLARVGIARLKLIDFDIVEPSNLNRQHYFIKHLWQKKTTALKSQISEINPFVNVEILDIRMDQTNSAKILKDEKIICECFDKPDSKAMLLNLVAENFSDKILILGSGMAGFESSNLIKTAKFTKNIYICGDQKSAATFGNGLMAPRVAICASHQANAALRAILDIYEI